MTRTVDIKAFIDQRPISAYQWVVVAICFMIVATDGMEVAIMGYVTPSILAEWGISRSIFGIVISAAPVGMMIGALLGGPLSDRFGRKPVLIVAVLIFGLLTMAASQASTPSEMAVLRLLAGTGLGAAVPNTLALMSEYAPQRRRSLMITGMFSGFNFGAGIIGFIAAWLIPHYGWRSVLIVGGMIPLAIVPVMLLFLPESARVLALRGAASEKIAAVLSRVTGHHFAGDEQFVSVEPKLQSRTPIGILFSPGYAVMTVLLWVTYIMSLLVVFTMLGWLPTLLTKGAGLSDSAAASVTAMFALGGAFGGIVLGYFMDKVRPPLVLGTAYFVCGLCILALASAGAVSIGLTALVFVAGFCINGANAGISAYATNCYPTMARATGVSWMLGMGRIGNISAGVVGGTLLGLGWSFGAIFGVLAIPAFLAAFSVAGTQIGARHREHADRADGPVLGGEVEIAH